MNKTGEWKKPVYGIFLIIVLSFVIITYSTSNAVMSDSKSNMDVNDIFDNKITGKVVTQEQTPHNPESSDYSMGDDNTAPAPTNNLDNVDPSKVIVRSSANVEKTKKNDGLIVSYEKGDGTTTKLLLSNSDEIVSNTQGQPNIKVSDMVNSNLDTLNNYFKENDIIVVKDINGDNKIIVSGVNAKVNYDQQYVTDYNRRYGSNLDYETPKNVNSISNEDANTKLPNLFVQKVIKEYFKQKDPKKIISVDEKEVLSIKDVKEKLGYTVDSQVQGDYILYTATSPDKKTIIKSTVGKNGNEIQSEIFTYDDDGKVYKLTQTCADEEDVVTDTRDYDVRKKQKEAIDKNVVKKYGDKSTVSSNFDGTTTFTSPGGNIVISPANSKTEPRKITYTVTGKDGKIREVKNLPSQKILGEILITIEGEDGKNFHVDQKCSNGKPCLKHQNTEYPINDIQADASKDPKKMMDLADDDYEATYGTESPETKANKNNAWRASEEKTRSKVTAIFNAYIDNIMGHLTNKVYSALCDYEMYEKDSDEQQKIVGIPVPSSSWESQLEKDIQENMRTAMFVSNVEAIGESMYRYDVLVKIIGDSSSGKWELYLKNSCDDKTSKEFWREEGMVSSGEVFELLLAGQRGEDMIFECGVDPACKFDKVCYKFENMDSVDCSFSIAGASKIGELCH
jgi:hypothetical protein